MKKFLLFNLLFFTSIVSAAPELTGGVWYFSQLHNIYRCQWKVTTSTPEEATIVTPYTNMAECYLIPSTANNYNDVNAFDWGWTAIDAVTYANLMSSCDGNGNFCPDAVVTRRQLAVILQRALNLPTRDWLTP